MEVYGRGMIFMLTCTDMIWNALQHAALFVSKVNEHRDGLCSCAGGGWSINVFCRNSEDSNVFLILCASVCAC